MQQAVLGMYPDANVSYRFTNRGKQKFSKKFLDALVSEINAMSSLSLTKNEESFLHTLPYMKDWYIEYLRSYRFDPNELDVKLNDGNLEIIITGKWYRTILWEVPLMALISELYFIIDDTKWTSDGQEKKLNDKISKLMANNCLYFDFGTRRRRNFATQDMIVGKMKSHYWFGGTSNPYLAMKYNTKVSGTMAHEWVQGISALESMNHPNRFMMKKWTDFYGPYLNVALTDTYGIKSFLKDFDFNLASIFKSLRHDSGCPFKFTDIFVEYYKKLGIDPKTKTLVFSDGLNVDSAVKISKYCIEKGINCSFGIGTFFTNDFDTPALNMVIKLTSVNSEPVVKLSEDIGKASGNLEYIDIMRKIHF